MLEFNLIVHICNEVIVSGMTILPSPFGDTSLYTREADKICIFLYKCLIVTIITKVKKAAPYGTAL